MYVACVNFPFRGSSSCVQHRRRVWEARRKKTTSTGRCNECYRCVVACACARDGQRVREVVKRFNTRVSAGARASDGYRSVTAVINTLWTARVERKEENEMHRESPPLSARKRMLTNVPGVAPTVDIIHGRLPRTRYRVYTYTHAHIYGCT